MPHVPTLQGCGDIARRIFGILRSISAATPWQRSNTQSVDDGAFVHALERYAEAARAGDFAAAEVATQEAMSLAIQQYNEQPPELLAEEVDRCE